MVDTEAHQTQLVALRFARMQHVHVHVSDDVLTVDNVKDDKPYNDHTMISNTALPGFVSYHDVVFPSTAASSDDYLDKYRRRHRRLAALLRSIGTLVFVRYGAVSVAERQQFHDAMATLPTQYVLVVLDDSEE